MTSAATQPLNGHSYIYAGFWRRVPAFLLDASIILVAMIAVDALYIVSMGLPFDTAFTSQSLPNKSSVHYNPSPIGMAAGLVIGVGACFIFMRFIASLLFGVSTTDPVIFIAVAFGLILVSMTACYIPARKATKVDPLIALRYE